jgi:hypothetical protein
MDFVLEGLLIYFLFTNAIRTPEVLKQVVWTLLAAATFMGALVAYQQFTESYDSNFLGFAQVDNGLGFDAGGPARQRRLGGPLGMPNRFAQIMAVLVPVALYQFRSARTRMGSAFALGALVMILLGAALTFSRGAAVGLAFLFMLMIALGQVRVRHVALILVALALVAALVPQYSARVSSILNVASLATKSGSPGMDAADGSTRGRITEMVAARRVEGLSSTEAEAAVTLCPFCHASLSRSVASEGVALRVLDFVEIVHEALEGDHAAP